MVIEIDFYVDLCSVQKWTCPNAELGFQIFEMPREVEFIGRTLYLYIFDWQ